VSRLSFDTFFQSATKKPAPYGYQCRLACGERGGRAEAEWLAGGTTCHSQLINFPTGLGKTAAVVLAFKIPSGRAVSLIAFLCGHSWSRHETAFVRG
jgi:hypothetical protein